MVLTLGGVDIEDGVPGKEQVECGREEVEEEEKQEREKHEETTNAQTHNMEPCSEYAHNQTCNVHEKNYV